MDSFDIAISTLLFKAKQLIPDRPLSINFVSKSGNEYLLTLSLRMIKKDQK